VDVPAVSLFLFLRNGKVFKKFPQRLNPDCGARAYGTAEQVAKKGKNQFLSG
jgi:hypothetical protein